MDPRSSNRTLLVAILALMASVLASVIAAAQSYGKVSARVDLLEQAQPITREEWNEFRTDLAQRLDRIENKVDKYGK